MYKRQATIVYAGASGTIQGLNKLAGSTVKQGEPLCTVESADARNRVENARLSLQNAELAASMAADSLDDYNITSQITGTVIEKNFKAGDKVEGMNSGSLAVVYDMSYLKLEMAVDELDISKVEAGQSVTITADAVEGQTFTGVVDNVSINGTTAGGATSYPVTILIKDYGDLKPGMNVSAQIIGEVVPNALCIPCLFEVLWCLTHVNEYTKINAMYGPCNYKAVNWETRQGDGYTTEEYEAFSAAFNAATKA